MRIREVFFKTCKTYLRFTGEFQQTSYEAITVHTSIAVAQVVESARLYEIMNRFFGTLSEHIRRSLRPDSSVYGSAY
jgi:hypothetical protein